jgi:hypothetical protein
MAIVKLPTQLTIEIQNVKICFTGGRLESVPLLRAQPSSLDPFDVNSCSWQQQQLLYRSPVRHPTQLHGSKSVRRRNVHSVAGPIFQSAIEL